MAFVILANCIMIKAPVITPEFEELFNEAAAQHAAGDLQSALASYQKCLASFPSFGPTWGNIGRCLAGLDRHHEAIAAYEESLRLNPHSAEFLVHKAISLKCLGDTASARHDLTEALRIDPSYANALNALGLLEFEGRNFESARMLYNRALESALYITQSNLDEAMTYNNIGCLQRAEGKLSEAIDSFERALRLNPALTVCMSNLANAYLDAARHHDMLKQFEVALNSSSNQLIFANMLMGLLYPDGIDPLSIRARHEEWAARFCPAATKPQAFSDDREPLVSPNGSLRRLRVGYLTSDLREHASLKFLLPVLLHHSADVEVFVYASVRRPDAATAFCQSRFPHLTFVAHMSDQQLNDCIRSDRLDILIELNGHTENNRLSALAVKPAPVVCSWLGYPATTGMRSIDYRFVDRWTDPDELQAHCTEKLIRLQLGFNCYESLHPLPHVSASPLLRNGYVTFGSASNTRKLSTQTLSSWAAVLQAVPSARLSLKSSWFDDSSTRTHVTESLARYGLDPARLAFFGYLPGEDAHLKFYNEVDIALDTFPYNGTTTTCDALLMGVPVVTIRGSSHVSRVSFSILERVGVSELAAKNPDEFISIAQQLATDRSRLISLRNSLRSCFQSSSLGQHHTFVAHLEEVYRQLCGA